ALGMVKINLPISNGVPITGQTLGVMLAGALLGARLGGLSMAAFVVLVGAGAPLLSGFHGGAAIFASASGGWVLSWPVAAFVIGLLVERSWSKLRSWQVFLFNIIGGILVVYAIGIAYQIALTGMPLSVVLVQSATYLPGDLIKSFVAAIIA
ncbi:biotin transporter BioY, partial [Microbacteriaceae bacterium K1510]|nr:biotin transporter BioY [Microbacteriaceae bacterium K1510]